MSMDGVSSPATRASLQGADTAKMFSDYLLSAKAKQNAAYLRKQNEKLRGYLNLQTGKASLICDLVSESDRAALKQNRVDIWEWVQMKEKPGSPLLPSTFPVQFFVGKLGPIPVDPSNRDPPAHIVLPSSVLPSLRSYVCRRSGPGECTATFSLVSHKAYLDLARFFNLKRSAWYRHSWFGPIASELYPSIPLSLTVTTLEDIASSQHSGVNGKSLDLDESSILPIEFSPLSLVDEVNQRLAWFESELFLVGSSIVSAAAHASDQACLMLRRVTFLKNVVPTNTVWKGESAYILPANESCVGNHTAAARAVVLGIGALLDNVSFEYVQDWFESKITAFSRDLEDPGSADPEGRLHFLLGETMIRHEQMARTRDALGLSERAKKVLLSCGGVERDIGTPLERLSVYNPKTNPEGVFLCPTYLPAHLIRLVEWFETSLPQLRGKSDDGSFNVHVLHIDSEGEFFQLHTESGGSIIIFTGMSPKAERDLLETVRFRFRQDLQYPFRQLEDLLTSVCREWTLSRTDVVFGGDRAACPIASQSKTLREAPTAPWIDSDITEWYRFIHGRPGEDFFCVRTINPEQEERIVANSPMGFKNLVDCGPGRLVVEKDGCLCKKTFGADWLRQCWLAHPQSWHGYPQSGAGAAKSLSRHKLDWTVLYYAVADLIKAKMLTNTQESFNVDLVTPYIDYD